MTMARTVLDRLKASGIDFVVSVPCNTLGDLIALAANEPGLIHVPVTREEEGLGVCAGAALNGRLPAMLMQNSGLGNCFNALLSLTRLYRLPLIMLASYRGGPDDAILAQRPFGDAMRPLLQAIDAPFREIESQHDLDALSELAVLARQGQPVVGILHPALWKDGK